MDYKVRFYLCLFGGPVGLHKFYEKDYKKGFLYLFTLGLFMFGWIADCIKLYPSEKRIEKWDKEKELIMQERERIAQMDREGVAYCPQCHSTSIQYTERRKQLSLGRAAVGSMINPLAGAVGATTSKKYKGLVTCLKCGNRWKL